MVALLGEEFEVHVFGSDPSAAEKLHAAGATFHLYPLTRGMRPLRDAGSLAALRRAFRDLRPDVVHAYDSKPAALARLAARLAGVPLIIGTLPGMGCYMRTTAC
jgi:UDP-N-acetylglucosamine:LPS N-acetylglucosamine transferase